jgi:hypothetical protein
VSVPAARLGFGDRLSPRARAAAARAVAVVSRLLPPAAARRRPPGPHA